MRNVVTLAQRELNSQFFSPVAYGVITLFLVMSGIMFAMMSFQPGGEASVRAVFGPWMLLILLFIISLVTMRLLSEEFRSGTIETLMTAPVSDTDVVLGKYLAALIFYVVMLAPTVIYPILISMYGGLDLGLTVCCYLGLVMAGSLYIAAGVFFSTCTRSQVVAGMCTFVVLAMLTFLPRVAAQMQEGIVRVIFQHVAIDEQYLVFWRGMLDSRAVVFFVTGTAMFLFLAVKALEFRRWR